MISINNLKTRLLAFCLLCMLATFSSAQGKFSIQGTAGKEHDRQRVYLYQLEDGEKVEKVLLDSVEVKKGKFVFKGEQNAPHFALIELADGGKAHAVVMEKGKITLDMKTDRRGGTSLNDTLDLALQRIQPIFKGVEKADKELQELMEERTSKGASTSFLGDSLLKATINRANELFDQVRICVDDYKNSMVGAYLLYCGGMGLKLDVIEAMMDNASPAFRDNALTKKIIESRKKMEQRMKKQMEQLKAGRRAEEVGTSVKIKTGQHFPDGKLKDRSGKEVVLSDYAGKGKYVLLDFWASWCGPCRREMPNVKAAYAKYVSKGFEVVSISVDTKQKDWEKAIEDLGMTWTQLLDVDTADAYDVASIPSTFLIDPQGTVIAIGLRGEELEETLSKLFE